MAQKAIAMDDSFDGPHTLMATVYLLMRQFDDAIAEAEKAIALNPNGAANYAVLGAILGSAGNWQESAVYLRSRYGSVHLPASAIIILVRSRLFHVGAI